MIELPGWHAVTVRRWVLTWYVKELSYEAAHHSSCSQFISDMSASSSAVMAGGCDSSNPCDHDSSKPTQLFG